MSSTKRPDPVLTAERRHVVEEIALLVAVKAAVTLPECCLRPLYKGVIKDRIGLGERFQELGGNSCSYRTVHTIDDRLVTIP